MSLPKIRTTLTYMGSEIATRRKSSVGTTLDWVVQKVEHHNRNEGDIAFMNIKWDDFDEQLELKVENRCGQILPYDVETKTFFD